MHRPTIIFLLSHQITTVQSKTAEINNHINQPRKQPRQSIPAFAKQKHAQNKHNKQTNTTNYLTNQS